MANEDHAELAPSFSDVWGECFGAIQLSKLSLPQQDTEEALEGKAAHYVAMCYGMGHTLPVGADAGYGFKVDDDMIEGALLYREVVGSALDHAHFESPVRITRVHDSKCWGTPDYWRYDAATRTLRVVDYKYGHKYVEVFECKQLILYVLGVMELLQLNDAQTIVEMTLVQPRSYHRDGPVRQWTVGGEVLRPIANDLHFAAAKSLEPKPVATSGPWCEYCPARHNCKTLHQTVMAFADYSSTAEPLEMTPSDIGRELVILRTAAARIDARMVGLEEQATHIIKAGRFVPYFFLEENKPRQVWVDGSAEYVAQMGDVYGIQLRKPELNLITPKKAIAAGIAEAIVNLYSHTPRGKLKLVRDDQTKARKVFQK